MQQLLVAITFTTSMFITPALAKEPPVKFSLGAMQYDTAGNGSFVLSVQNTGVRSLSVNFACQFVTEDMTPFDPQVIQFDLAAYGKASKRIRTETAAYSASCDVEGGRTDDGGFWFSNDSKPLK